MSSIPRDLARSAAKSAAGVPAAGNPELSAAAQRAQTFAGGTGAAVLSLENDELICRATTGTSPVVGTRFPLTASFPGLCVKERKPLKCDEADNDARVENGPYTALKIKSIVVVPISQGQVVAGVLGVFSTSPSAFHNTHIAILRTMADGTLEMLRRLQDQSSGALAARPAFAAELPIEPLAADVKFAPAPPAMPGRPQAPEARPEFIVEHTPTAAVRPVAEPIPQAPAPEAKFRRPDPKLVPSAANHVPIGLSPKRVENEIVALASDVGTRRAAPARSYPVRRAPIPTRAVERRHAKREPSTRQRFVVMAVLILVIAGSCWAIYHKYSTLRAQRSGATTTDERTTPVAAEAPLPVTVAETSTPITPTPATLRDAFGSELSVPPSPAPRATVPESPQPRTSNRRTGGREGALPPAPSRAAAPLVNSAAPATPEFLPARMPQPAQSAPAQPTVEEPPKVSLASSNAPSPALLKPGAAPIPALKPKVAQVTPAEVIQRVPPRYPAIALSSHITGTVVVSASVTRDGRVSAVEFVSGNAMFRDAAVSAVKQWRFKPATVDGQPTEATARIELRFTSSGR